ncbi:YolD-like family protein [Paenibacillus thailandensis]|uniref:YolD-like family protein n=1 Tax=Paenibacillus thailandensis TaxID=393250 RepID=A0ABW5QTS7_9BACL
MQRKLLEGNGMWESSRMMLPEHKAALNEHYIQSKRRPRVELDESEWELISRAVAESLQLRKVIELRMYDPFEELVVRGVVERVDQFGSRFMVDGEWFKVQDVEGATVED